MDTKTPNKKRRWSVRRKILAAALVTLAVLVVGLVLVGMRSLSGFGSFGPNDPQEDRKWAPYEGLLSDVGRDDLGAVTRDLDRGVDPDKFPSDGYARQQERDTAALTEAAGDGHLPMIVLLLARGADPNLGDGWDGTPLAAAAANDRVDVMALLVARGAKVRDDKAGDSDALWTAATQGKLAAVKFLLAHGANPNMTMGAQPPETLLAATREGHQDAAATLLRQAGARE